MIIETKFNIGNKVFFLKDNKVCEKEIIGVSTYKVGDCEDIEYKLYDEGWIDESRVFLTKEELINSL